MEITIKIEKCADCKHNSHTGAFTKGGAKPDCNHPQTVKEKGNSCFDRIIPYKTVEYLGSDCHVPKEIPEWCPLKRSFSY